jgi:glucarate dehydratase
VKISKLKVTQAATHDQPLLNSTGVHESFRIRTIVQVETDDGFTGAGETYQDQAAVIEPNREWLIGWDPRQITGARLRFKGSPAAWAAVETALLDAAAKHAGLPLCDYIGGRARDRVDWAAYLFYKFADENGQGEVATGPALDPAGFVKQAEEFVAKYGFKALKIKGGFFHPDVDIETFRLLRKRFPKSKGYEIRIDPNAVWTVETSIRVAKAIEPYEPQYMEDPTDTIAMHAEVKKHTDIPMASNMCVSAFSHVKPNVKLGGIDVILGDHHHWGGILAYKETVMV